jgi:methionyl-tRNA formyltransferase
MRIILIGQAAFAEKVFDGLRADGHDVAAVYCPPDPPAGKVDPVKARALAAGVPVRQHKSLRGDSVRDEFGDLRADLGVLAYVTQIVPPTIFDVPRLGSICFHPSLLPRYRGGSAVNWQIIRGERETGVSVFWVDAGIDTGPILLQKRDVIGPDDTAGSLYYDKLFPLGVEVVLESVRAIDGGRAPRQPQDESLATYDPLCRDEHGEIEWAQPIQAVYDLVRGCDPQPGAYTVFRGQKLRLFDCRRREGAASPGTIIDTSEGLLVAAAGGAILAKRVRWDGPKLPATEFAAAQNLIAGSRLVGALAAQDAS